jgi:hypothetical protein
MRLFFALEPLECPFIRRVALWIFDFFMVFIGIPHLKVWPRTCVDGERSGDGRDANRGGRRVRTVASEPGVSPADRAPEPTGGHRLPWFSLKQRCVIFITWAWRYGVAHCRTTSAAFRSYSLGHERVQAPGERPTTGVIREMGDAACSGPVRLYGRCP